MKDNMTKLSEQYLHNIIMESINAMQQAEKDINSYKNTQKPKKQFQNIVKDYDNSDDAKAIRKLSHEENRYEHDFYPHQKLSMRQNDTDFLEPDSYIEDYLNN